ncbi:ferric-chelate reductase 1 [Anguilla rostrata]|uniref:ferric-chelate reductase 1 n=1 Tax=Anguilla rostrata TaxID=7938 RepID=UPI0030CCB136
MRTSSLHQVKMMGFQLFFSLAVFAVYTEGTVAYSNGNVSNVCGSMIPGHYGSPQTSPSPYTVSASMSSYSPGDRIMVTLEAPGSSPAFQGFMLQARVKGNLDPVGCFVSFNSSLSQTLDCSNMTNSSISHRSNIHKTQVKATWEAPRNARPGDIMFCATFVEDYTMFWVNVNSPLIKMASSSFQLNLPPSKYILLAATGLFLNYY